MVAEGADRAHVRLAELVAALSLGIAALRAEEAASELGGEAKSGRFDADAVEAVLGAGGVGNEGPSERTPNMGCMSHETQ
jgi:hypothetical protein